MSKGRKKGNGSKARFKKGDRVRFRWGPQSPEGEIVEDRGPIGMGAASFTGSSLTSGPIR